MSVERNTFKTRASQNLSSFWNCVRQLMFFFSHCRDFSHKLSLSLIANPNLALHTLDLSNNLIEDKGNFFFVYSTQLTSLD